MGRSSPVKGANYFNGLSNVVTLYCLHFSPCASTLASGLLYGLLLTGTYLWGCLLLPAGVSPLSSIWLRDRAIALLCAFLFNSLKSFANLPLGAVFFRST